MLLRHLQLASTVGTVIVCLWTRHLMQPTRLLRDVRSYNLQVEKYQRKLLSMSYDIIFVLGYIEDSDHHVGSIGISRLH